MITGQSLITKQDKMKVVNETFKDESIDLKTLYKLHYTRYGSKRAFFFALRRCNIISSNSGDRSKGSERSRDLFKWSDELKTDRLNLYSREAFGKRFKLEIKAVMECITKQFDSIDEAYLRDVEYFSNGVTRTEGKRRASSIRSDRKKEVLDLNRSKC